MLILTEIPTHFFSISGTSWAISTETTRPQEELEVAISEEEANKDVETR